MRSPITVTISMAVGLVIGFFARTPQTGARNPFQATDAASRDGLFQARLDVESGRKPHLASYRWGANTDRALFIAAYVQAYQEAFEARVGNLPKADGAEVAGYRDGIADGNAHQAASQSPQPEKTNNYINAGQGFSQIYEDDARFHQEYQDAYLNGYQLGYYARQKASQWGYYSQ